MSSGTQSPSGFPRVMETGKVREIDPVPGKKGIQTFGHKTFGHKTFGHKTFGHKTFGHKVAGTTFGHSMKSSL